VLLALVVAVALAAAGPGTVADTTSRPALRSFQLVSVGGGSGGVTGHAIWATTWWNGTPEGPGPYEGTPGAGQPICIWHDLGSGVANLDGGLSEASLPVSFWKPPDGGGHPGIWGIDQWAAMVMRGGRATDHFDLVACPDTDQVPPTAGEVEADLPLAYPPKSAPLYVWLFWDTVPDPPSGHRLAIIGQALARTRLPSPGIGTSPSEVGGVIDSTVVNLPTWLWVNNGLWRTYSAFASGGGYRATVWAVPVTVQWSAAWDFPSSADDPEGGTTFGPEVLDRVCQGPGQVYNPDAHGETTDCSFDFTQSSFGTYQRLRAAVTWDVSWALSDRAGVVGGEGSLGTIVTSASRPLRVLQVESVITGG
jgi:hypothetical protein